MKKLLLTTFAIFMVCQAIWANQADDFKYNKQQVQDEFSTLNLLEKTVTDNSFVTLSEMQQNNMLTANYANLNLTNNMMMDPALGIPGFLWGCLLGPLGILAVYVITENDKAEVKKALIGCLVGVGVEVIFYVIYYAAVYSSY